MEGKDIERSAESDADTRSFEESLAELQTIVAAMESGDQSLEKSLDEFERGISLIRQCQRKLEQAQQRVEVLTAKNGEDDVAPFSPQKSD
ncbi:MAG: exodeoxyribonuclease VII small subunit [Acidiferrobacterales bacterium]|nr:exodeoxyribonuclease VII small subunit [Acidiferrobacterales bacterium]